MLRGGGMFNDGTYLNRKCFYASFTDDSPFSIVLFRMRLRKHTFVCEVVACTATTLLQSFPNVGYAGLRIFMSTRMSSTVFSTKYVPVDHGR